MNMKKSIAGVMAGAMAVSAMATTVSAVDAQESITLYYDLNEWVYDNWTKDGSTPSVTLMEYFASSADAKSMVLDKAEADDVKDGKIGTMTLGAAHLGKMEDWGFNPNYKYNLQSVDLQLRANAAEGVAGTVDAKVDWTWSSKSTVAQSIVQPSNAPQVTVPLTNGTVGTNLVDIHAFDLGTLGYMPTEFTTDVDTDGDGIADTTETTYANVPTGWYGFTSINAKMTFGVTGNGWNASVTEATMKTELATCATTEIEDVHGNPLKPTTYQVTDGNWTEWVIVGKAPMKTSLKNPGDVIAAVKTGKEWGNKYTNPIAVLNDAIANGTNVTFTFTTAAADIVTDDANPNKSGRYYAKDSGVFAKGLDFDGNGSTDNQLWATTNFQQHLYQDGTITPGFAGAGQGSLDQFGSYSNAWGYNLFEGAIVVNSNITMQLNQAQKFIWDANSLTFDWDTITADGNITNAKTLLTSMLLYTPVDWYWDSLEVVVEAEEKDPALENPELNSPIEEDDDLLGGEDEEITTTEATTAATTAAVADVAGTPATGNAPVALAVIPVALAAAAVVAKKRG